MPIHTTARMRVSAILPGNTKKLKEDERGLKINF